MNAVAAGLSSGAHEKPAVCELFVRHLPRNRRFLVAAGLNDALEVLARFRFTDAQIEQLQHAAGLAGVLSPTFEDFLRGFRFRGDVWAVPEGTVMFQNEPLVQVRGTLAEVQLVETVLLSTVNFQTMIASKAARIALHKHDLDLVEIGARRTHPDAAAAVARAAYIAGFDATTNVEAFARYDVPVRPLLGHLFVLAADSEEQAFENYVNHARSGVVVVDTYDPLEGVRRAVAVLGDRLRWVRLDSGDLADGAVALRAVLDELGRQDVKIMVSSDLDEYRLAALSGRAPIDAAGVGTRLCTSEDAPALGGVYKLVEIDGRGVGKLSQGKQTLPGRHQVYRSVKNGVLDGDIVGLDDERSYAFVDTQRLLVPVMERGRVTREDDIHQARARARAGLASLPAGVRDIGERDDEVREPYPVTLSDRLEAALAGLSA